jgi:hypothetical protein
MQRACTVLDLDVIGRGVCIPYRAYHAIAMGLNYWSSVAVVSGRKDVNAGAGREGHHRTCNI